MQETVPFFELLQRGEQKEKGAKGQKRRGGFVCLKQCDNHEITSNKNP